MGGARGGGFFVLGLVFGLVLVLFDGDWDGDCFGGEEEEVEDGDGEVEVGKGDRGVVVVVG